MRQHNICCVYVRSVWRGMPAYLSKQSTRTHNIFQVFFNLTRKMGILYEYLFTFITRTVLYNSILLRMRIILDKNCIENQNTFSVQKLLPRET